MSVLSQSFWVKIFNIRVTSLHSYRVPANDDNLGLIA